MTKYIGLITVQVKEEKPVLFTSTKKAYGFLTNRCGLDIPYESFKEKIQEGPITLFGKDSDDYYRVYVFNDNEIDP